ncbi:esterase/lipase family protein [Actinokineospora guangxiensis]|uniref:Esterase/lipase family protein n=1 Tax=Actinokineospora guangxiensis TaxID=1490288 RepID=A0ABW0EVH2_9PSEU
MRRWIAVLAAAAGLVAVPGVAQAELPVPYSLVGGFFANPAAAIDPNKAPPGANRWSCEPDAAHPRPVVLLHGLGANQGLNWSTMSPVLANAGHCVFSLTYGAQWWLPSVGGMRPMKESAATLSRFVDRVLAETGAAEVDLVGHSEGSTVAAYYLKRLGGADKVGTLVGLSPNYAGTSLYGLTFLADNLPPLLSAVLTSVCAARKDFYPGSAFMKDLNAGGSAAVPGVRYVNVQGALEQVVLPNSSGTLPGAENVRVNTGCAQDLSDHISIVSSRRAAQMMLNALTPAEAKPLPCAFNPPFLS